MKILIAEDNEKNLKLIRELLRAKDYETIEARNGVEALHMAAEELPALVLMDIYMPLMDGIAAMKALKGNPLTRHIPVVALTSSVMRGDMEKFLGEGFDGYVPKPINLKGFLKTVDEFLAGGRRT